MNKSLLRKRASEMARQKIFTKFGGKLDGNEMLVTSTSIPNFKSTQFYGFKLAKAGIYSLGQRIHNFDGTITTVEEIIR